MILNECPSETAKKVVQMTELMTCTQNGGVQRKVIPTYNKRYSAVAWNRAPSFSGMVVVHSIPV